MNPGIRAALKGHDPSDEQWAAIKAPPGPLAVVAGAGSGKTAVMAARLVWLVDQGHAPDCLLGLTFTHKAAAELGERIALALAAMGAEGAPTVTTYHGFAAQLVASAGARLGLVGDRLVSEAQRWQVLLQAADQVDFRVLELKTTERLAGALLLGSRLADHLLSPEQVIEFDTAFPGRAMRKLAQDVRRTCAERRELARLVSAFQTKKRSLGLVDYDDQISLAVALARLPAVREAVRARWSAALLDEYQDTNVAQVALVHALFADPDFPVTAVGDPQQAIYGFRGATMDNVVTFGERFGAEKPLPLRVSYRSDRLVVAAANAVAAGLPPDQRGVPLLARDDAGEGRIQMFYATDHEAEARAIAQRVAGLEGTYEWGEIAVLLRARRPLLESLRTELEDRGIPVEVVGLGGLLDVPEVVELVCTLRVLDDPSADRFLARSLLGPRVRLSAGDLAALYRWRRGEHRTLLEAVRAAAEGRVAEVSVEAAARSRIVVDEMDTLHRSLGRPLPELAEAVLDVRGLRAEVDSRVGPRREAGLRHLSSFLDHVARFAPFEGDTSLRAFLRYLDALEREPDEMETVLPPADDAVHLLTIHQAKGLEFDAVFLPLLATDRFPSVRAGESWVDHRTEVPSPLRTDARFLPNFDDVRHVYAAFKKEVMKHSITEERRVFYVGLTRARHLVVASGAWFYGRNQRPSRPSLFYDELSRVEGVEVEPCPEAPDTNPLILNAEAEAAAWPGPGRGEARDALFPKGLSASLASIDEMMARLEPAARAEAEAERSRLEAEAGRRLPPRPEPAPASLSVSSLETLARCPRAFYWERVRPLPQVTGRAAAYGRQVHEEIERRALGLDPVDVARPEPPAVTGDDGGAPSALAAFAGSRFAGRAPEQVEAPFALLRPPFVVRGRIDAVYPRPDGVEVVDWKTGEPTPTDDPAAGLQMDLYGLAMVEAFGRRPEEVTVTVAYLAHREERTEAFDHRRAAARLGTLLTTAAAADWSATPGAWCRRCDHAAVCPWAAPDAVQEH